MELKKQQVERPYCTIGMTEKAQDTPDGGWELVFEQGCKCKAFTEKQFQYDESQSMKKLGWLYAIRKVCVCGHHVRDHEFRTNQQIADFAWQQMNQ